MSHTIIFPASLKSQLQEIAAEREYPVVQEILQRGGSEELLIHSQQEAQALVDVARIEMLNAALKYPYWDEDHAAYDSRHEEAFQDIQMGIFEKTLMYLGQAYKLTTTV